MLRAGDEQDIIDDVSSKVLKVMDREERSEMDDEDREWIRKRVGKMARAAFDQYEAERNKPTRFPRADRVVCNVGGDRRWASGTIQAINEVDPEDQMGETRLPYVVKIDAPNPRLISVPKDDWNVCRAEVCFGQREGALWFTLFCMQHSAVKKERRFALGERVAVAVEDDTDDYSVWAAGTIRDVDYSVEKDATALMPDRKWSDGAACIPYRVELDTGCMVLVHRDEHWLLRDLALQAEGSRQVPKGVPSSARCLNRLEKRHRGDYTWEAVDHATRRVRMCDPPSDDEHGEDCGCGC